RRRMLAAGQVLGQAHQEQVHLRALDDDGGHVLLAEGDKSLQPSLTADQTVASLVAAQLDECHGYRLLQAPLGDVADDLAELLLAAVTRVEHRDLLHGDHADPGVVRDVHAATSILRRLAKLVKWSRLSNW